MHMKIDDDTDYAMIDIDDSSRYHDDKDIMIGIEINYSEKSRNYQKLHNGHSVYGRSYTVDCIDRIYRSDVTQFLDMSLMDDIICTEYSLDESYIITHGLLLRILENNAKVFSKLYKKPVFQDDLKLLSFSSQNSRSIENVKQYHENRLKDCLGRLDRFLV